MVLPRYIKKATSCPDPVLSKLQPDRYFGAVSERFSLSVTKYTEENPDKCLADEDCEERFEYYLSLFSCLYVYLYSIVHSKVYSLRDSNDDKMIAPRIFTCDYFISTIVVHLSCSF